MDGNFFFLVPVMARPSNFVGLGLCEAEAALTRPRGRGEAETRPQAKLIKNYFGDKCAIVVFFAL